MKYAEKKKQRFVTTYFTALPDISPMYLWNFFGAYINNTSNLDERFQINENNQMIGGWPTKK